VGAAELPIGGTVISGTGSINSNGTAMTIEQAGQRLDIDWQSFSIGQGRSVTFVQPDSHAVAFNRVIGSDVSSLQGALNANGQVFLANPNGIVFSSTAQVNVGGLLATTLQISQQDGQYVLRGDSNASIVQQGQLAAAEGGTIALIAARIVNSGEISATRGSVLFGAGNSVTLDLGGPVKIRVEEGALNALIEQGGAIRADGGTVYLTAKAADRLSTAAISHTGLTQARTMSTNERGEIAWQAH
jgi:filamentous hemagglutinin family protein